MRVQKKYIIPIAGIVVGVFFLIYSYSKYTVFAANQGPGDGFLPMLLGALLLFASIADMLMARSRTNVSFGAENWSIVLAVAILISATYLIGMIPSILVFSFLWIRMVEKCSWKMTIIALLVIIALVIGVFQLWMDIDFPQGLLIEWLLG